MEGWKLQSVLPYLLFDLAPACGARLSVGQCFRGLFADGSAESAMSGATCPVRQTGPTDADTHSIVSAAALPPYRLPIALRNPASRALPSPAICFQSFANSRRIRLAASENGRIVPSRSPEPA